MLHHGDQERVDSTPMFYTNLVMQQAEVPEFLSHDANVNSSYSTVRASEQTMRRLSQSCFTHANLHDSMKIRRGVQGQWLSPPPLYF